MKKQKNYKKNVNPNTIVAVVFLAALFLMSIGFASFNTKLALDGFVLVSPPPDTGVVEVIGVERISNRNVNKLGTYSIEDDKITVNFGNSTYNNAGNIVYRVMVVNNSKYEWTYNGAQTNTTKNTTQGTYTVGVKGLNEGDKIGPGNSAFLNVTLTANRRMQATAKATFEFESTFVGTFKSFIQVATVDLTEENWRLVKFAVSSPYEEDRTFTIAPSNTDFAFYNADGSEVGMFTAHNGINKYEVYIKYNEAVDFYSPSENIKLDVYPDGLTPISTDSFTALIPYEEDAVDDIPPQIGPVTIAQTSVTGKIDIVWSREDEGGSSVQGYNILIYNDDGVLQQEIVTNDTKTAYTLKDTDVVLDNDLYYVIIYGRDRFNTGEEYVESATESSLYARSSAVTKMEWVYTVTFDTNGYNHTGEATAVRGSNYSGSVTANNGNPNTITVAMDGVELDTNNTKSSYYTYSNNTGAFTIYNVQGNIVITTQTTCLVEGTKILLADGTTKNVEDISYNDLLLVWDYEHGMFTYEYPIWIEKEGHRKSYQLTTFDDNSTLKTVSYHGIYSNDDKAFVNIDDSLKFKVGTSVPKLVNDNGQYKFKNVKVKDIKNIEEDVNYYEVVTTTYYNVISDNFLTTDGNVILVNMYGFDNNIKWLQSREKEYLFTYDELRGVLPYYLYKGLRADEVKFFVKNGLIDYSDIDFYKKEIVSINDMILKPVPVNERGKRMWMVTTSFDKVKNTEDYLYEERSIYTLPKVNDKNFIGFYNTADGKMYKSGDKYQVIYGTHFIAKYEQN